ncbi:MAG: hypothetical protein IIX84_07785, partial [Oscillospiraceae bacterium]|nr:hypothetical protein [Oscillospiraceae bacterium]
IEMEWIICLRVALIALAVSVLLALLRAVTRYKRGRILDPVKILFAGVVVASATLFIPIYTVTFKDSGCGALETFFISVHNMIRLFVVDGDYTFVVERLVGLSEEMYSVYSALFSVLFVVAPLLTFGFVLSFFKNISAYFVYFLNFNSNVYVFSELSEKSLALANDIAKQRLSWFKLFVFTDVFNKEEESNYELIEQAKELGAICFKKDISSISFKFHNPLASIRFFVIGADEDENINQSIKLAKRYRYSNNCDLYVFSTRVESDLLLAKSYTEEKRSFRGFFTYQPKIRIRRINEVQSLIYRLLYDEGDKIFDEALPEEESGLKKISAAIIGMGQHGTEMCKALAWFCQMTGYRVEIDCFDIDADTESKFCSLCPELMDERYNRFDTPEGEAEYKINIHSGIDVATTEFDRKITSLGGLTYVFVSLGTDEQNISTAIKLRTLFEREGMKPRINSIVYNSDKSAAMNGITNYRGQSYDIDFVGDLKTSYSVKVVLDSDVEEAALLRHLKWSDDEKPFWQYNYNYRSSVASAIHRKMKIHCRIPGIELEPKDRSESDRRLIRVLEHCRWNAYMRAEGYCFGEERNDLAKQHPNLVEFDKLPLKVQEFDDD